MPKMMTPSEYANACDQIDKLFRQIRRKNSYPHLHLVFKWSGGCAQVFRTGSVKSGQKRRLRREYPAPPNSSPYAEDYPDTGSEYE